MKNTSLEIKILHLASVILTIITVLSVVAHEANRLKTDLLGILVPTAHGQSWNECQSTSDKSEYCQDLNKIMDEQVNHFYNGHKKYLDENPITPEYAEEQTSLWRKISNILVSLLD